jgi:hypothetical protein
MLPIREGLDKSTAFLVLSRIVPGLLLPVSQSSPAEADNVVLRINDEFFWVDTVWVGF